jgi:hypothetical protein
MALQTNKLTLVGLGIDNDVPSDPLQLIRRSAGEDQVLREGAAVIPVERAMLVTVERDGARLQVFLDGEQIVSVVEGSRREGAQDSSRRARDSSARRRRCLRSQRTRSSRRSPTS